ncbi:hypothetical protein Daus18300_001399 [Diaporthe australafricana]|uniref:non-specific serine/threonine protein kinase n=1 Tax=Diaporthe australafricana TaxID=127596 RepID=A0ABR3XVL3_9PEZI
METSAASDSHFRIRCGESVKYVIVAPETFDDDELLMALDCLPPLPYDKDEWNFARVSRTAGDPKLHVSLDFRPLRGLSESWHPQCIDILSLEKVNLLSVNTFECILKDEPTQNDQISADSRTYVAKIARFEWEIPRLERETHAYQVIQHTDIGPRFLGHIHEQGRIIGFLLEKLDGRPAGIEDLSQCQEVLGRYHGLGLIHGDVNRYNFIIGESRVKMVDFEHYQETSSQEQMNSEMLSLPSELEDESGRGAGFLTDDEED